MVWGIFPADPHTGEDKYYIFSRGTYKVGRKGCDIIITKDKGVSRIHAEIVVDTMASLDHSQHKSLSEFSNILIRDCSKYGTFINKNLKSKEKVHEFPNKETTLKDGDFISFGTGNATYRFCFIPFVFFVYCSKSIDANQLLRDKISSLGGRISLVWNPECTHMLVDQSMSLTEDVIDAIVAKKPVVLTNWVEFVAEKNICTEIPSFSSYAPTFTLDGVSVKAAEPITRENCLRWYTFLLESTQKYKFKDRLQSLLEMVGAKVVSAEGFCSSSQSLEDEENSREVYVLPARSVDNAECSQKLSSLYKVNEINLICAALSGHLDPAILISPSVLVSSSTSTDETVVADSDVEVETATSVRTSPTVHTVEVTKHESKGLLPMDHAVVGLETGHIRCSGDQTDIVTTRRGQIDESECGNPNIIYSQNLIVRNTDFPAPVYSSTDNGLPNFKCFRKTKTQSGNSFSNLIPFSKYPYKDSDYGNEEVIEYVKEEKKRKQMEAIAEDLFNNEKARRRGVAGSLRGLFAHS